MATTVIPRESPAGFRYKSLIIAWIFAVLSYGTSLCQTTKIQSYGISFLSGDFQTALQKAKAAGKPLFVEIYLKGCPHCEALAPVLSEKAVGDFYNEKFISWKTEANTRESTAFQQTKGIKYPEFPLLFFFDTNGELIHMSTPPEKKIRADFIKEILSVGNIALDPQKRTGSYPARLAAGERDLMFLIDYGKYCKAVKDPGKLAQINDILGKTLTAPQDITGQAGFYILQRLIDDIDNPMAVYFFNHLDEFRAKYASKDVKETGEAILYHTLYGPKGDSYSNAKLVQMRKKMVELGVPAPEAMARLLIKELDAFVRAKNTASAFQHFNEYRAISPLGTADYAYVMKYFNEKAADNSYLNQMPVWAGEGIRSAKPEDVNSKQMAGLYYELAEAHNKMGQMEAALKNAQKALETAKIAKDELKRYEALVIKLK